MTEGPDHQLPSTWATAKIADVAEINPKLDKSEIDDQVEVSFVPMPALEAGTGRIDVSATRPFQEVKKGYTPFREGDVLFAKITPCMENGKMAIVPALQNGHGFGSTEFHVLRPLNGISAKFLYYFVSSQRFRFNAEHNMTGGVGQRRVPTAHFSNHPIRVPPSIEQRRIVAKIEGLLSELDKGVENLTTAREQLKVYRLAILDQATGGPQSSDYDTHLLGDLIGRIQQGWSPRCDVNSRPLDDEWAIIKTTAIQPMRYVPLECKPLPTTLEPRHGIEIQDGDILMTRKGPRPRTGVVCYVKEARPRSMLCDTVYRFRAKESVVIPQYLEIALNAPRVLAQIDEKKSGISDSGISLNHGRIKSINVPVPRHRTWQEDIVRSVGRKLSVVASIDAELCEQMERCKVLRQAILQRAFAGQLVAQYPKDEPASVLLARIRSGKEGGNKRRKRRIGA